MADKNIFSFSDEFDVSSPFDNWLHGVTNSPSNSNNVSTRTSARSGATVHFLNKERIYAIKTDVILEFVVYGATSWINDTSYTIGLTSSTQALKISTKSWTAENGYKLLTKVSLDKPGKVSLYISVDGIRKYTFDVEFRKSKDVFTQEDVQRLKQEFAEMMHYVDDHYPQEYAGNYCMQGADRAIGKLLQNSTDFYVVDLNTHKVKNSIVFSNLTTYTRAKQLYAKGFIDSFYEIDSKYWNVNHEYIQGTYKSPDYESARAYIIPKQFDMVWVNEQRGEAFKNYLKKQIDSREPGWHVYYLSVVDGYHTQVLLIDNTNRYKPLFAIYEDHGKSSSSGNFDDIVVQGINRQNSSMFASSCLWNYKRGIKTWYSQTLKIWKIQAKK